MLARISWRPNWPKNSMPQKQRFQAPNCKWCSDWYQTEIWRMRCSEAIPQETGKRHAGAEQHDGRVGAEFAGFQRFGHGIDLTHRLDNIFVKTAHDHTRGNGADNAFDRGF